MGAKWSSMRFKNLGWPIPSSFTMDMGSWIVHVSKVPLLGVVSTKRSISTDNDILRGLGTSHPEIKGNFKDQKAQNRWHSKFNGSKWSFRNSPINQYRRALMMDHGWFFYPCSRQSHSTTSNTCRMFTYSLCFMAFHFGRHPVASVVLVPKSLLR